MKYLILLIFSFSVHANWIPSDKVGVCEPLTVFLKKKDCEGHYSKDCSKIPREYNCEYSTLQPSAQLKEQTASCVDADDCQAKFEALTCSSEGFSKIKNLDLMEVYCTKFRPEQVVINQSAKSSYESAKSEKELLKSALRVVRKRREHGQEVIDLMILRNSQKGLNPGQKKQVLQTYSDIKSLLEVGNLEEAKNAINNETVDGVLINESDKTALISKIDEYTE